jgi:hypothetical protein
LSEQGLKGAVRITKILGSSTTRRTATAESTVFKVDVAVRSSESKRLGGGFRMTTPSTAMCRI